MNVPRQRRILYVNHTGCISGAERVLIETVRTLDREHYEPIVACPVHGALTEELKALGVATVPLPVVQARFASRPDRIARSVMALARATRALHAVVRGFSPDLIHANSVRAGIMATLARGERSIPLIWHVHDDLPRHPASTAVRTLFLLSHNTCALAVSDATRRRFQGHCPIAKRMFVIHNGIDLSRFSSDQSSHRKAFREEIGVGEEEFLVCAVGQICDRKGLLGLINAFARVHEQLPTMHLVIAGKVVFEHEAGHLAQLQRAVDEWRIGDRVHFCGEVQNVPLLLQSSDLMVLNSKEEPFGLVVVEAMASRTPVLATRVGGIPEIVHDAENGWITSPGDVNELASKLVKLSRSRDELRRAADRALHETCPMFSLDRYKSELEMLYRRLCSQARSSLRATVISFSGR